MTARIKHGIVIVGQNIGQFYGIRQRQLCISIGFEAVGGSCLGGNLIAFRV